MKAGEYPKRVALTVGGVHITLPKEGDEWPVLYR